MSKFTVRVKFDDRPFESHGVYKVWADDKNGKFIFGAHANVEFSETHGHWVARWGSCNASMERMESQYACITEAIQLARKLNKEEVGTVAK